MTKNYIICAIKLKQNFMIISQISFRFLFVFNNILLIKNYGYRILVF